VIRARQRGGIRSITLKIEKRERKRKMRRAKQFNEYMEDEKKIKVDRKEEQGE
jgi:hypothetical protein